MDIQMPGMDGFEAAAEIRKREAATGANRTPIIAVTANVGTAEAEQCNISMDGCLSKPINAEVFLAAIAKILSPAAADSDIKKNEGCSNESMRFNRSDLLDRIGGDGETFKRLVSLFRAKAPQHSLTLRDAFLKSDLATLRKEAHALRGAAANMSAQNAAELARQIECFAAEGKLEPIGPQLKLLDQELDLLCLELGRHENAVNAADGEGDD
jgi:HPt (histidine-containing phosphotransfer) domain-containing protein